MDTDVHYFFPFPIYCSQLSMWRCSDELCARADELHRSSKRDAKHYIGMSLVVLIFVVCFMVAN